MNKFFLFALLIIKITAFSQTIPPYVPACGLIAWYPFSGNTIDSTMHGNNGTNFGATLTTDRFGHPNSAYYFDGLTNYIYIPSGSGPNSLYIPGSVSIAAWVKTTNYSYGGQAQIFWRGDNVSAHDQYMLYTYGGDIGIRRDVGTGTTTLTLGYPSAGIDSNFHHFVGTYDSASGTMSVYYDGNLVTSSYMPGIESYPTSAFFNVIGAVNYMPSWQYFLGTIDDIGVWNRALTLCEVRELYHATYAFCLDSLHSYTDTTVCSSVGTLTLSGRAGYSTYMWSTGSTGSSIAVSTSGIYWVISSNSSCNSSVDTFNVIYGLHDTLHSYRDTILCASSRPATLYGRPGFTSYLWSTGGTTSSLAVSSSGSYWVNSSDSTCVSAFDTVNVTFVSNDTLYSHIDTALCISAGPLTFRGRVGYNSYLWNTGGTSSSITVNNSGNYWVYSLDSSCTTAIDSFYCLFTPLPVVSLGSDTTICKGTMITLSCSEPTGTSFLWNTGSTAPFITISDAGNYTITVTERGCSASASVNVLEATFPVVSLGMDTTVCKGDQFGLSVNIAEAALTWSTSSHAQSIFINEPGTYWVTATNACGTSTDTINVDFQLCDVVFPSAFTPNGDGKNDIIKVEGSLNKCSDFQLSIFNRFGERVFYTDNIFDGWNGLYNGVKQDIGTYFYLIHYTIEDKKHVIKGDFQLIR